VQLSASQEWFFFSWNYLVIRQGFVRGSCDPYQGILLYLKWTSKAVSVWLFPSHSIHSRSFFTFCWQTIHVELLKYGDSWQTYLIFARVGEDKKVNKVLVRKPEGKRPLERQRRRWEDGNRMVLRQTGWVVWSGSSWLRIRIGGGLLWWTLSRSGATELVNSFEDILFLY
jgi:hypothetical protein